MSTVLPSLPDGFAQRVRDGYAAEGKATDCVLPLLVLFFAFSATTTWIEANITVNCDIGIVYLQKGNNTLEVSDAVNCSSMQQDRYVYMLCALFCLLIRFYFGVRSSLNLTRR